MPRTYRFNKLVAVDLVEIPWKREGNPDLLVNYLNVIDHGTNFQILLRVGDGFSKTAEDVWSAFQKGWIRYFGEPEILISDEGNEFEGDFAAKLEQAGVFHHMSDAESP